MHPVHTYKLGDKIEDDEYDLSVKELKYLKPIIIDNPGNFIYLSCRGYYKVTNILKIDKKRKDLFARSICVKYKILIILDL